MLTTVHFHQEWTVGFEQQSAVDASSVRICSLMVMTVFALSFAREKSLRVISYMTPHYGHA